MDPFLFLLGAMGASGALVSWRNRVRWRSAVEQQRAIAQMLDDSMQVALHLAQHEAKSRDQPLAPAHVLAALVQDEQVAAAITALGGDPTRVEAALDAALDQLPASTDPREAPMLLGSALAMAQHHGRALGCADALAALLRTRHAALLDVAPLTAYDLLFSLVHGPALPPSQLPGETEVFVVLRNDDFTTQELVVRLLRDTFGLPSDTAMTTMHAVHTGGRAAVARLPAQLAHDRVLAARAIARTAGMPLWLGVEVC